MREHSSSIAATVKRFNYYDRRCNSGEIPSHVTSKCYFIFNGDIEFYSNQNDDSKTIEVKDGTCDSLLALDSEDNFYCVEELDNGRQLIRIDRNTREALAITPETDQEILQAVVSSNDEQVLFTASREDDSDSITAYVVAAAGGTEPRELSALTGQLSKDQKLYSWTAKSGRIEPEQTTPE